MDENLLPLGKVFLQRRQHMVLGVIKEISEQRLPKQPIRIQPRVVKRAHSRYDRKKPEHASAPALELDMEFGEIIAVVPCIQGLSRVPEIPPLPCGKGTPGPVSGDKTRDSGTRESPVCQPTPDLLDTSSPSASTDAPSSPSKRTQGKTSNAREPTCKTGLTCATRAP